MPDAPKTKTAPFDIARAVSTRMEQDGLRTRAAARSTLHGQFHQLTVGANALLIIQDQWTYGTQFTQDEVWACYLFALIHDSQRFDDGVDPSHGVRAATLVAYFKEDRQTHLIFKDHKVWDRLFEAVLQHCNPRAKISQDVISAVCWDADRLDLGRVRIRPDASYLSTPFAQRRALAIQKNHAIKMRNYASWHGLAAAFDKMAKQIAKRAPETPSYV